MLPLRGEKIPEHGRQLFSKTASFAHRFKLAVNVLGIILLASSDRAHDDDATFRINTVNDAMVSELVLPIPCQRTAQWKSVPFRVDGQLFL